MEAWSSNFLSAPINFSVDTPLRSVIYRLRRIGLVAVLTFRLAPSSVSSLSHMHAVCRVIPGLFGLRYLVQSFVSEVRFSEVVLIS